MANSQKYFDPETLSKLHSLALRSATVLEGMVAGAHRSSMLGHSVEFANHREYSHGDDLREIDWKVFARRDKFYVKQFEDESNLSCYLMLDHSQSMTYRGETSPLSKLQYGQVLCCCIAHLVLSQQDNVGFIGFGDRIDQWLTSSNNPAQQEDLIRVLDKGEVAKTTDLSKVFQDTIARLASRSLLVLVSDLLVDLDSIEQALRLVRAAGHDILVFRVLDFDEIVFPFDESTEFQGLEGLGNMIADASLVAAAYRDSMKNQNEQLRRMCSMLDFDFHVVDSSKPLSHVLPPLLEKRRWR